MEINSQVLSLKEINLRISSFAWKVYFQEKQRRCIKYPRIRFFVTRIFPYRMEHSIFIREYVGQRKPSFCHILRSERSNIFSKYRVDYCFERTNFFKIDSAYFKVQKESTSEIRFYLKTHSLV